MADAEVTHAPATTSDVAVEGAHVDAAAAVPPAADGAVKKERKEKKEKKEKKERVPGEKKEKKEKKVRSLFFSSMRHSLFNIIHVGEAGKRRAQAQAHSS